MFRVLFFVQYKIIHYKHFKKYLSIVNLILIILLFLSYLNVTIALIIKMTLMIQRKITIGFLSLLIGVLCLSCGTSLKVSTDFDKSIDFKKYKTFSVYDLKQTGSVNPANADKIVSALKKQMQEKGFVEDRQNPDLHVNAVSILTAKEAVAMDAAPTNYYGYGGTYRPYGYYGVGYGYGYSENPSTRENEYDFKEGTLMIDLIDTKTQKMVWQGVGKTEIDTKPVNIDEVINYAVGAIMLSFPPQPIK